MTSAISRPRTDRDGYIRFVRGNAWYDLAVTAAFATPWTLVLAHLALTELSEALGLRGMPELDPVTTLYANLMGSVVVVWALLRLVRTQRIHGLFDGGARMMFSAWMAYALAQGAPPVLWAFLVVEVSLGVGELAGWLRSHPARRH